MFYDAVLKFALFALYGVNRGFNVLDEEWDNLVILDACRYDLFRLVYKEFFPDGKLKIAVSKASSTMEFVKKHFLNERFGDRLKDIIYINSNPVVDNVLGNKISKLFFKYVPVWRYSWDENIGTVNPKSVYFHTLKMFVNYPNQKMIVHFLQPHFPFLAEEYMYLNKACTEMMNRERVERSKMNENHDNLEDLAEILGGYIRNKFLCAGIPTALALYMRERTREVLGAYKKNLEIVLYYVSKLSNILPGKTVITADHGEAFGERLHKMIPISVYGHPSRIRIKPLICVPYLECKGKYSHDRAVQIALRTFLQSVTN